MLKHLIFTLFFWSVIYSIAFTQNVPIQNYTINNLGQVELEIEAQADKYYILTTNHEPSSNYESNTSITMGVDGNLIITEPLGAYSEQNYKVTAYDIDEPGDIDNDGIDDITEFNNTPNVSPLNFADEISIQDGSVYIDSKEMFSELAVVNDDIPWAPFLNNQEFAKFVIVNQDSDEARVYFVNSKTHYIHADFIYTIDTNDDEVTTGEIVYNPNEIMPNGVIGSYSFNYSFGDAYSFEYTQKTFELLAANMPFLQNNFQHFIGSQGENTYENNYKNDYEGSRINVVLESEFVEDVDYIPFNQAEGFGFFRQMTLDENPGSRDVVLYDALPNSLPRVGGIITSVIQTPLSHVNLRAIQDNLPNAYIKNPLEIDSISNLLEKYIYYKVEQDKYIIREATIEEVNAWYEKLRPTEDQIPERDLSKTEILPLDEIEFEMATSFGAKCANVATMRKFGFPEGTIPNGFGVPFYYYDEFMKFNGFYEKVENMISDPTFISDLESRIEILSDFRKEIKDADMPQWMLDDLQEMHDSFPEGTSIRCRSSTNNEDLPGFSGAGLYTSKTQHPEEGHISKSIKQVYASMWNFRAYDERDFYRIDHYIAAMGVLCHPNYQDEKSNGVGVSIDPIYETENTFYLNTQVGEFLITNPDANSIPEEILLNTDPEEGYTVLRRSNLVGNNELVMGEDYLNLMREYLSVIHDEFEILYNVVGAEGFGMDIEYKVTKDDQLIIKQARPWVSFWSNIKSNFDLGVVEITKPQSASTLGDSELVTAKIANQGLREIRDFELSLILNNEIVETLSISDTLAPQSSKEYQFTTPIDLSEIGFYNVGAIVYHAEDGYSTNDTLISTISKLHLLEGGIMASLKKVDCSNAIEATATITNYGESSFSNTQIEVIVNGITVDTFDYGFSIPYLAEVNITIPISENLQEENNEITLNLLSINGEQDAISTNNSSSFTTSLDTEYDNVTLTINTDDFSEETSWELRDDQSNEIVGSGVLGANLEFYTADVCVNYNSCFTLYVYDTYSDGICCSFGEGNFSLENNIGETLISNNGDFGSKAVEFFCLDGEGCGLTADVQTINASNANASDGTIIISTDSESEAFEYSIDGGENYTTDNIFENLSSGEYTIIVANQAANCYYEENIFLGINNISSTEEYASNDLILFPNPTTGIFYFDTNNKYGFSSGLHLEIYNHLGELINKDSFSEKESDGKAKFSLEPYANGIYVIKCFNQDFEKYFRVVKI